MRKRKRFLINFVPIKNVLVRKRKATKTKFINGTYSKTCVKRPLSKRPKIGFKTNYRLMQVKSIAESAILSTINKLPFVIKVFCFMSLGVAVYTGFTVFSEAIVSEI